MERIKWEDAINSSPQVVRNTEVFVTNGVLVKQAKMYYGKAIPDYKCKSSDVFGRFLDVKTNEDISDWVTHWSLIPSGQSGTADAEWCDINDVPSGELEGRVFFLQLDDSKTSCAEFKFDKFWKPGTFIALSQRAKRWMEVVPPQIKSII